MGPLGSVANEALARSFGEGMETLETFVTAVHVVVCADNEAAAVCHAVRAVIAETLSEAHITVQPEDHAKACGTSTAA